MSRQLLVDRFLSQLRGFLDCDGAAIEIWERSEPPISNDSIYDSLSVSLRREGHTIRIPNIAFGDCHKGSGIFPHVMGLIENHPTVLCVQFEGIKRGELREAGIEKHGYVLEDDGENATWHKPGVR